MLSRSLLRQSNLLLSSARLISTTPVVMNNLPPAYQKSQALNRPISPHLTIYKGGASYFVSGSFRVASVAMSSGVYAGALLYAVRSADAASYIELIKSLELHPLIITAGKFTLALPFVNHLVMGIRHLVSDMGWYLTSHGTQQTAIITLICSVVGAGALTVL